MLNSVSELTHEVICSDTALRENFFDGEKKNAFVVSVDIRRSTELMLKARTPFEFSNFITRLCDRLIQIFKRNFGVVDKFTGDGILAFFPDFYSGKHAGYYTLRACSEAISAFNACYRESRASFTTILKDVGIGVGVDYGSVQLLRMAGSLTVVGQPVVYACRLGGAPAGHILFNQPAFERISEAYPHVTTITETELELKHEGTIICYDVELKSSDFEPDLPTWFQNAEEGNAPESTSVDVSSD